MRGVQATANHLYSSIRRPIWRRAVFLEVYPQVLGTSTVKVCKTCGDAKPLSEYSPCRSGLFGVKAHCKQCRAEQQGEYYRAHREQSAEAVRDWQSHNPEKVKEYKRKSALANREKRNTKAKECYAVFPEHRERLRANSDKWRRANLEQVRDAHRRRRHADPDRYMSYVHRRRARKISNGGSYTAEDVARQIAGQTDKRGDVRCWICGKPMPENDRTIDHFIPLFLGGTNDPGNIRIAHGCCNSKKGRKHPHEMGRLI